VDRQLTDDERWLIQHIGRWGSDGYPVSKCGSRHWTWGPVRSIQGPPVCFPTKKEAVKSFENYMDVLRGLLGQEAFERTRRELKARQVVAGSELLQ
jgi:hypothetical protein